MTHRQAPASHLQQITAQLIGVWGVWLIVMWALAALAPLFLPYLPSFPYSDTLLAASRLPRVLYSWANFDGVHYLTIAQHGYIGTGFVQAFFPFFPTLIGALALLARTSPILVGVVLNALSIGALIGVLQLTLRSDERLRPLAKHPAAVALFYLLLPTAFFFQAMYTETLFLTFALLAFMAARQQRWGIATLLTALAVVTRIVGVFVWAGLMVEAYQQSRARSHSWWPDAQCWKRWLLVTPALAGLLCYMAFLWWEFGDPFYFFTVQSAYGAGRQSSLVLYPQVLWRAFKILLTSPLDVRYLTSLQEALVSVLGLILFYLAIRTRQRWSTLVFAAGAFFLPPLTGTLSSMPRYVLVCFPLWFALMIWLKPGTWKWNLWLLCSTLLLLCNTMLFIQGFWIA